MIGPLQFPRTVNAFSLSSTVDVAVLGGDDGALVVVDLGCSPPRGPVSLSGAVGDVLATTFFPSGEVTLSATLAGTILVHSALAPSSSTSTATHEPVRVLRGHTRPVTCTAILGRGRQVLSGSKDGSVRSWEVASPTEIARLDFGDEISAIVLEDDHSGWVATLPGRLAQIHLDDKAAITSTLR